jgi:uncharacterized spore protein YtfJ
MTTDMQHRIEQQAAGRAESFIERLAGALGGHAGARAVFGEPVEGNGVTVITVARARWAFGGGGGTGRGKDESEGSGSGGGGALSVSPMGFIELKNGAAEFRPIRSQGIEAALGLALVIVASAFATGVLLGGLRRLVRPK